MTIPCIRLHNSCSQGKGAFDGSNPASPGLLSQGQWGQRKLTGKVDGVSATTPSSTTDRSSSLLQPIHVQTNSSTPSLPQSLPSTPGGLSVSGLTSASHSWSSASNASRSDLSLSLSLSLSLTHSHTLSLSTPLSHFLSHSPCLSVCLFLSLKDTHTHTYIHTHTHTYTHTHTHTHTHTCKQIDR